VSLEQVDKDGDGLDTLKSRNSFPEKMRHFNKQGTFLDVFEKATCGGLSRVSME
jgi:hypothetical protein